MTDSTTEKPQTYANHTRFDPLFHFSLAPILIIILIYAIVAMVRSHREFHLHLFIAIFALLLIWLSERARSYALKVQDRVIRLEERLRLAALLPEPLRARIPELTPKQLIALRFASDAEVPALVERTLNENLEPKVIKQSIQNWRPDHLRV